MRVHTLFTAALVAGLGLAGANVASAWQLGGGGAAGGGGGSAAGGGAAGAAGGSAAANVSGGGVGARAGVGRAGVGVRGPATANPLAQGQGSLGAAGANAAGQNFRSTIGGVANDGTGVNANGIAPDAQTQQGAGSTVQSAAQGRLNAQRAARARRNQTNQNGTPNASQQARERASQNSRFNRDPQAADAQNNLSPSQNRTNQFDNSQQNSRDPFNVNGEQAAQEDGTLFVDQDSPEGRTPRTTNEGRVRRGPRTMQQQQTSDPSVGASGEVETDANSRAASSRTQRSAAARSGVRRGEVSVTAGSDAEQSSRATSQRQATTRTGAQGSSIAPGEWDDVPAPNSKNEDTQAPRSTTSRRQSTATRRAQTSSIAPGEWEDVPPPFDQIEDGRVPGSDADTTTRDASTFNDNTQFGSPATGRSQRFDSGRNRRTGSDIEARFGQRNNTGYDDGRVQPTGDDIQNEDTGTSRSPNFTSGGNIVSGGTNAGRLPRGTTRSNRTGSTTTSGGTVLDEGSSILSGDTFTGTGGSGIGSFATDAAGTSSGSVGGTTGGAFGTGATTSTTGDDADDMPLDDDGATTDDDTGRYQPPRTRPPVDISTDPGLGATDTAMDNRTGFASRDFSAFDRQSGRDTGEGDNAFDRNDRAERNRYGTAGPSTRRRSVTNSNRNLQDASGVTGSNTYSGGTAGTGGRTSKVFGDTGTSSSSATGKRQGTGLIPSATPNNPPKQRTPF